MKIASLILGILGGIAGIFGAILGVFIGGVGGAIGTEGSSVVVIGGFLAIFLSIIGIIGGAMAMAKPHMSGIMMSIAAVGGLIAISAGYIVAFPLLITGGIISFVVSKKEGSFGWKSILISMISSVVLITIIMSQGSSTKDNQKRAQAENQKTNVATTQKKEKTKSAKEPTAIQSFYGASKIIGAWEVADEEFAEEDQYLVINKDGSAMLQKGSNMAWKATYELKGNNIISFDKYEFNDEIFDRLFGFWFMTDINFEYYCVGDELTFTEEFQGEYRSIKLLRARKQPPPIIDKSLKTSIPATSEQKSVSEKPVEKEPGEEKITLIDKIEIGTKRAEDGEIIDDGSRFLQEAGDIKVSVYLSNAKRGQKVNAVWYLENEKISNPIGSLITSDGDYIAKFSLPSSSKGWTPGNYKIVISMDEPGISKEVTYVIERSQGKTPEEKLEINQEASPALEESGKNTREEEKQEKNVPDVFSGFMKEFKQSIDETKK